MVEGWGAVPVRPHLSGPPVETGDTPPRPPPRHPEACSSGQVQSLRCGSVGPTSARACMWHVILAPNPPFTEPLGAVPVLPQPSAPLPPTWVSFAEGPAALRRAQQGPCLCRGSTQPSCTAMQWRSRSPWGTRWLVTSPASSGASSPWVGSSPFPSPPK